MNDNYPDNLQYNSCIARGICSINPRTYALQTVLVLYLHLCSKYCLKLYEKNALDNSTTDLFINISAISLSTPEITESCFSDVISKLKIMLPDLITIYNSLYGQNDFEDEDIIKSDIFKKCENIVDAIKLGEELSRKTAENLNQEIRDIYKIMLVIAKCLSVKLLELRSYDISAYTGLKEIFQLFDAINIKKPASSTMLNLIKNSAKRNVDLLTELHNMQELRYGIQKTARVSYSTTPSKAILVVGTNLRELENIMEQLKETDIDVYTHDDMMLAHTFPFFHQYKNLKGQYGHGLENCLVDFATFPGPIILTKYSLHNVENLYRGRLFTTDKYTLKGIIPILGNDYSEVIQSAITAKGFKTGKICDTVKIGYVYNEVIQLIEDKIQTGDYKRIILIGLSNNTKEQKEYFDRLISSVPSDNLVISFSYNASRENFIHINACFDYFSIIRIFDYLKNSQKKITIIFPQCNISTISQIIYFKSLNANVFIGEYTPTILNPSLISTMKNLFKIETITTAKNDLKRILTE